MSYPADRHRLVSDPFGHGDSAPRLGMMMNLVDGFEFPWRDGGVALLRRELYPQVAGWTHCGLAVDTQLVVQNYPGMNHLANQAYQYTVAAFLGNGLASVLTEPLRLDFDGGGNLITPRLPNFPVDLCAVALAGGKFRVSFSYGAYGQGGAPVDFQVFEGADAASVNYGVPLVDSVTGLDKVAARTTGRVLSLTTPVYAEQSRHVFGVRARSSAGVAELNVFVTAEVIARAATPIAAAAPQAVHVRAYSAAGGGRGA